MRSVLSTFLSAALSALALALTSGAILLTSWASPSPVQAAPMGASAALITVNSAAPSSVATLPGLKGVFASERPQNLGVQAGKLASCPASPNCVVSQGADEAHTIAPILYEGDRAAARQALMDILGVVPRTRIVLRSDDYILAESESRLMGFVDDNEFYFPQDEKVIHMRAAARMGESDLGVNRRRLEQIRLAFNDLSTRQRLSE